MIKIYLITVIPNGKVTGTIVYSNGYMFDTIYA